MGKAAQATNTARQLTSGKIFHGGAGRGETGNLTGQIAQSSFKPNKSLCHRPLL